MQRLTSIWHLRDLGKILPHDNLLGILTAAKNDSYL